MRQFVISNFVFVVILITGLIVTVQSEIIRRSISSTGNTGEYDVNDYDYGPGGQDDLVSGVYTATEVDGDDGVRIDNDTPGFSPFTTEALQQIMSDTATASAQTATPPKLKTSRSTYLPIVPEVETKDGVVRGKVVTVNTKLSSGERVEKEVVTFLGIPFAKPPTGDLRFKRPVRSGKWNGTLNATTRPNSCSQHPFDSFPGFQGEQMWNPNTNVSEDCLYLNIWVPDTVFRAKGSATLDPATVLFWIHGGGFYSGTSTLDVYDGASLAAHQNVIVASTQYRLGAMGFLYFGNEEVPGNMGLVDQNMALQWVNENVAVFGGNPAEVTLFGESAGGASVSYHLLSPLSRSLFKRAVLMSGVATAPWAFKSKTDATVVSYKIAKEVGCWSDDSRSDITQVIDCLKRVDHNTITNAQALHVTKILELPVAPTVDDYFLLNTPNNVVQSWDTKKSDIIVGTVSDEGSFFPVYSFKKYFSHLEPTSISYDVFISTLRDIFKDRPVFERDAIIAHYTNWKNLEDGVQNQKRISEAIGDAFFVCPCREFALKWSGRGLNVFYYLFAQRSSTNPWAEWMGVLHGDEIEYAFGQPVKSIQRANAEVTLSLKFMDLLANFARTGTPSQNWEKYTPEQQIFLNLNGTTISDTSSANLFGPRATECAFWNNYLPRLRQSVESGSCSLTPSGIPTPLSQAKFSRPCGDTPHIPLVTRRNKFGW